MRDLLIPNLPGAGLGVKRGVEALLFAGDGPPRVPLPEARVGCFRIGDSGLGSDGRILGLNIGLGARAPGPMDCEKFMVGVGEV